MARTTQLLAKLKRLAADARTNLYERIKLAAEVLEDRDWVAQSFDGDLAKAEEAVGQDYFSDVGRMYTLGTLLSVLKRFPKEAQWVEYRHDIHALVAVWESEHQPEEKTPSITRKRATVAELEAAEKRIAELERELTRLRAENESLRQQIDAWLERDRTLLVTA